MRNCKKCGTPHEGRWYKDSDGVKSICHSCGIRGVHAKIKQTKAQRAQDGIATTKGDADEVPKGANKHDRRPRQKTEAPAVLGRETAARPTAQATDTTKQAGRLTLKVGARLATLLSTDTERQKTSEATEGQVSSTTSSSATKKRAHSELADLSKLQDPIYIEDHENHEDKKLKKDQELVPAAHFKASTVQPIVDSKAYLSGSPSVTGIPTSTQDKLHPPTSANELISKLNETLNDHIRQAEISKAEISRLLGKVRETEEQLHQATNQVKELEGAAEDNKKQRDELSEGRDKDQKKILELVAEAQRKTEEIERQRRLMHSLIDAGHRQVYKVE